MTHNFLNTYAPFLRCLWGWIQNDVLFVFMNSQVLMMTMWRHWWRYSTRKTISSTRWRSACWQWKTKMASWWQVLSRDLLLNLFRCVTSLRLLLAMFVCLFTFALRINSPIFSKYQCISLTKSSIRPYELNFRRFLIIESNMQVLRNSTMFH